jgi:hypothetical protein
MQRRLSLEVQGLGDFVEVEDAADSSGHVVRCLCAGTEEDVIVEFQMSRGWPFRPPVVQVNGIDFFRFVSTIHHAPSPEKLALVKRVWGRRTCGVCDSILCPGNWFPTTRLKDIVREIALNLEVRARVRDCVRLRMAVGRHWGADVLSVVESFM